MSQQPKLTQRTKSGLIVWSILALGIVLTPRIIRTYFPGDPIKIEIKTLKKIKRFLEINNLVLSFNSTIYFLNLQQ